MAAPERPSWLQIASVTVYLIVATGVRCWELNRSQENLIQDRDAYLAIARTLADGFGYRSSPEGHATAYRPPLYPCLLAAGIRLGGIESEAGLKAWVGGLNLLLSLLTILLTVHLARMWFGRESTALIWIWVCFDPLLIHNVTLPMTETLFTFLLVVLLWTFEPPGSEPTVKPSVRRGMAQGFAFGLCALCRPTIWAFGVLWGAWVVGREWKRRGLRSSLRRAAVPMLSAAVTISPWVVRNAVQFGAFVPMTTHGGYTLLLGNNPVFYREVASKSWRTVWPQESLREWQGGLETKMEADGVPSGDELARNRWMYREAAEYITKHPGRFVHTSGIRLARFWNVAPLAASDSDAGRLIGRLSLFFFGSLFLCVVISAGLRRDLNRRLLPLWCLVLSFTLVHAVFWSNLRMRCPLEPVLALIAVAGLSPRRIVRGDPSAANRPTEGGL